jgi:hypothetical protein
VAAARVAPLYSRRFVSRIETYEHIWVCWRCEGVEDISRVCDLSVGGLFLSSPTSRPVGARVRLEFLIPEGQIRAEAIVQHVIPHGGLGLKFAAITDQDCPNLIALINRICRPPRPLLVATTPSTSPDMNDPLGRAPILMDSGGPRHFSTENL